MSITLVQLIYLLSAACFIFGLKQLSSPKTAPRGNMTGAFGMLLATVATVVTWQLSGEPIRVTENLVWIALAIAGGAIVGTVLAKKIEMTDMPQLVAIFNGPCGRSWESVSWASAIDSLENTSCTVR